MPYRSKSDYKEYQRQYRQSKARQRISDRRKWFLSQYSIKDLSNLPPIEQEIIGSYYNLRESNKNLTYKQIGEILGCTKQEVCRRMKTAFKKLNQYKALKVYNLTAKR